MMHNAEHKYRQALELYRTTDRPITEISRECGVTRDGLASYIQRCHRELMYLRHGIATESADRKMWHSKGQTPRCHEKYREAIEACDSETYIDLNVSQIARMYDLDGTSLAYQLNMHYPEIIERRENERRRRGIADNFRRGARPSAVRTYSGALRLLETTDMTIAEAAEAAGVSYTGLRHHLLLYHKDLVSSRENRRLQGKMSPRIGKPSGNGAIRRASAEDSLRFAAAVELYRTTGLSMKEICAITGNSLSAFTSHMRLWHKRLMFNRRGVEMPDGGSDRQSLVGVRRSDPAVSAKYAPAVSALEAGGKSVEDVAREFGFTPEVFRSYLRLHRPDLWRKMGMTRLDNGRRVLRRSSEKYAGAIRLYRTTPEPLKSIARRLGLTYGSLVSFIHRNVPEAIEEHNRLLPDTDGR